MRHGSLFSGIGGFDFAAERMGWENIFHCELNPFCNKILNYYWPNAHSHTNISETNFSVYNGQIDILTGGFPCQPYSVAGKRKGKDDERHLWPEMLRAIREIEPKWIVGENVRGLVSWNGGMVFDEVCADLETENYTVLPFILPAAGVNAPHRRDRIWFIAYRDTKQREREVGRVFAKFNDGAESIGVTAYADNPGNRSGHGEIQRANEEVPERYNCAVLGHADSRAITDTDCKRHSGKKHRKTFTEFNTENNKGFRWKNFPTQPPFCTENDGFPGRLDGITFPKWRNESIKAAGNAIVPQVAFEIFKAIEHYNSLQP